MIPTPDPTGQSLQSDREAAPTPDPSEAPGLAGGDSAERRRTLVRAAAWIYPPLFVFSAWWDPSWLWALGQPQALGGLGVGLVAGALAVWIMRIGERWAWMDQLGEELCGMLGAVNEREAAGLAFASSLGEEALFRGVLLPAWGLAGSSVAFGALHMAGGRLWYYPLLAGAMGLAFAGLALTTGSLAAPIACHAVINWLNLRALGRRARERGLS